MALTIGKYIKYALTECNTELDGMVDGRVFPVCCPDVETTPVPYIIYWNEGMDEADTKDGIYSDTVEVKVMAVAMTYAGLMDVLPLIRKAMQSAWTNWNAMSDRPFSIADQQMHYDADGWDIEFGYYTGQFTYRIETEDNNE